MFLLFHLATQPFSKKKILLGGLMDWVRCITQNRNQKRRENQGLHTLRRVVLTRGSRNCHGLSKPNLGAKCRLTENTIHHCHVVTAYEKSAPEICHWPFFNKTDYNYIINKLRSLWKTNPEIIQNTLKCHNDIHFK
ncbi:hypothetical protein PHAVU_011G112600 [Phaseolus vulgaris]|uniref:Uncharacterized protein n=1 Tax=Phaseolus vulgaris TaxID=3885 RepID=V7AKL8_PHAVU|nr:hypothetical protein PHAVU_011G112600g [Phaseolus vulgaris]ESW04636.1 hypothetical protein PHAVU_011G112600g [Phaseolus vulgaris]